MNQSKLISKICRKAVKNHNYIVVMPAEPPIWLQHEMQQYRPPQYKNRMFGSYNEFIEETNE